MKYQRKPESTVEAFVWTGGPDQTEDPEWAVKAIENGVMWFLEKGKQHFLVVLTPYGQVLANPGDYIFLDKDGYNVAPKEYFEKMFTPTLEEQIEKILSEGERRSLEILLKYMGVK